MAREGLACPTRVSAEGPWGLHTGEGLLPVLFKGGRQHWHLYWEEPLAGSLRELLPRAEGVLDAPKAL